jgi:L-rhamnose isomerase
MTEEMAGKAYELARKRYAELGVDTESALAALSQVSLSVHCWQGDDVGGFERPQASLSGGGIRVTGSHPGKARTVGELRADLEKALSLIPGRHRVNLHAMYGEFGGERVDRDQYQPRHFRGWVEWAGERGVKLDFNATCFSHPKAESGFTLSHRDRGIRGFWVEHVKRCREIAAFMGRELGDCCIHNLWVPDGEKDAPVDRWGRRELLKGSLDEIYATDYPAEQMKDALESKLFGIGSEAFVVGSHEFYLAYALGRRKMVCLDLGHFHPTESIADKLSSILQFSDELLLHISRGVRWDSDHVVVLSDEVREVMAEIVRGGALGRVHLALDFFDASISRVGAWVIGARATLQALLAALLEPRGKIGEAEQAADSFARLSLLEEAKLLPLGAVWEECCVRAGAPTASECREEIHRYEAEVTSRWGNGGRGADLPRG